MELIAVVMLVLLAGGWVVLNRIGGAKYRSVTKLHMEGLRLKRLAPPMLYVVERLKLMSRFPLFFFKIQRSIQKLNGQRYSAELTLLYAGEMMAYGWLLLMLGCLLTLAMKDAAGLAIGGAMGVLVPAAMIKDMHGKVVKRDQDILTELPELLNKIVLLVGAGETVKRRSATAWSRKSSRFIIRSTAS